MEFNSESELAGQESQELSDFQAKILSKCDAYRSAAKKDAEKLASDKQALRADFSEKTSEDLQKEIEKYKLEMSQLKEDSNRTIQRTPSFVEYILNMR